jgi:hypothetical protein
MLTFLHAADIHLDSPLRGLSHYEGAPPIVEPYLSESRGCPRSKATECEAVVVYREPSAT